MKILYPNHLEVEYEQMIDWYLYLTCVPVLFNYLKIWSELAKNDESIV